jgi:hypothetical protein
VLRTETARRARIRPGGMKQWPAKGGWPSWLEQRGWPRRLRGLRSGWKDTSPGLRSLGVVMWVTGVVLVVSGWIADSRGFWSDRPFLTNLASSLTGAVFGIPFVLVIFQQITTAQTQSKEATDTRRLAARVSRQMLDAARNMVQSSPGAMKALTGSAAREQEQPSHRTLTGSEQPGRE